ncbi:MAG: peptidyl-prolyl cis-trans isomerase [Flavobacteriaceae bacterium]
MKQYQLTYIFTLVLCFSSCNLSIKNSTDSALARVNQTVLNKEDVSETLFDGLTKEDSTVQMQRIINDWATQQLLIEGAKINLDNSQQQNFESLVEQYKNDLYISAYLEALVKQNLDTLVTSEELAKVYDQNKELFVLKEDLIRLRYINHDEKLSNANDIKRRFKRYNLEDQIVLDTLSIQFNSFFLNDSVWIKSDQVLDKIRPLQIGFNSLLLKKPNFIQLKDSLGLYLMQINDVLTSGNQAPMAYVLPTLKQIIINKRKLKLVNQLKNEIVNDAIKNEKFEIYN